MTTPSMTLNRLIELLNNDLSREYGHWHFYMAAAARVTGLHREEYREFFLKQAASEMQHIDQFACMIVGLGGHPSSCYEKYEITLATHPEAFLELALKQELEVVQHYVDRIEQCVDLQVNGGQDAVDGKYVEIFLEDQISDSRADADHIKQLLK